MASSSTASVLENFKYHVFLSFRGEDTRTNFVDHLYTSLKRLGIHTFRDNEELEKGKRIDELFKAIDESKFFIIVFSKDYASSSWCLMELAKIMNCQDGNKRIAFPLFYYVDPSDIRKQSGPVGRAIARHKTNGQIKKWEKALEDAGNLVGWDIKKIANGHEAEAINQIVKTISLKLRLVHLRKDENLVGMESRMKNLESVLGKGLDDEVRMIGIKGMGGIGKTTLARAIFQKISSQFEGKSFVDDVKEASKGQGGLLSLQKQVLKDVLSDDRVSSVQDAISMMEDRMPLQKVLLVLDNVDHIDQLQALAGAWFKGGSRIIVTARDKQVLTTHGMNIIIDINLLPDEEALSLFCRYAFKTYIPFEGYGDLSFKVVEYAAGLPLTLKVLGSSMFGKKEPYWIDAIKRLETIPCGETLDKLKISYDDLENDQKEIFQDVACFMKGKPKNDAIRMLESRGFYAIAGLTVLEDRSLITISNDNLDMHDSIQELGRIIVRGLPPHELELKNHSRLWNREEIEALLCDDEVIEATATCISVGWLDLSDEIIMKGFGKLKKLKFLQNFVLHDTYSRHNSMFDQCSFPNSLQFLEWWRYPGRSLPQTFQANNLVGLLLPHSKITKFWENGELKVLRNLRFLNLSFSNLSTLDLGMTPNLERLDLKNCLALTEIDMPVGCIKKLVFLNILGCSWCISSLFIKQLQSFELLSLPKLEVHGQSSYPWVGPLQKRSFECYYVDEEQTSLPETNQKSVSLNLPSDTKIESVSGSFIGSQQIRHLTFKGLFPELPNDLDQLANLEELNLLSTNVEFLPDSICKLKHLKYLKLKKCMFLEELPRDLGQLVYLEKLSFASTRIKCLPDSICMLKHLKSIKIESSHLKELPMDLGQLVCLEKLTLLYTHIKHLPDSICKLKHLKSLRLEFCQLLEELPRDLGRLVYLENLTLLSASIKHLPYSISMMKNLKSLELQSCRLLKKLPTDLGQLESLEKLILIECASLKDIPNNICNMKCLTYLCLPLCKQVKSLPEELGSLEHLKVLDIRFTGIRQIPQSIYSLQGLRIYGSEAFLRSCDFATEIHTSEGETFCYIQALDNTETGPRLKNQFTDNFYNRHEAEAIDQIVKEISVKLRSIHLRKDENLVGMETRMEALECSLKIGLDNEVYRTGIEGLGGIGKTTLARAIFHTLSSQFEGASFVENVREASTEQGGLMLLQKQILRDVLRDESVNSVQDAISMMKDRMPLKKVLLVLDDVGDKDQLQALAGAWFKNGSRIIVTTRDLQVARAYNANIINVNLLSNEEANSLFGRYAFKSYIPIEGYEDLSSEIVQHVGGHPLTLKVLGSFLLGKEKDTWVDILNRLKPNPWWEALKINPWWETLKISCESLKDDQKEIFLDVACFMKGMLKKDAIRMLESCGFHAIIGLTVLEERSLITISNQCLGMHDSIQKLGWNIVRRSHPHDPNKHSRLWVSKEIEALLSDDEVTEATATCIRLKSADLSPEIIMKGLGKLKKLRLLHISERDSGWPRSGRTWDDDDDDCPYDNWMCNQDNFPNALRFLKWESYPGRSLPQTFQINNLVGLELLGSRITKLWESGEQEVLSNLRFLNLSYSKLRTLDLGVTPNLESLDLDGCDDLTEIHAPVGCLERLVYLSLVGCSKAGCSSFIQQVESLDLLSLPKLRVSVMSIPRYTRDKLPELRFTCSYLEEQASSLEENKKSVSLDLEPGTKLESVSGSFFGLQHLRQLIFDGPIPELPNDLEQLANLEILKLVETHIKCLPDSICMLKHLKSLKLESCRLLEKLPEGLGQLERLEKLILTECESLKDIPNSICNMKRLKVLDIRLTGISQLPQGISSLEGLRIVGSEAVLQSCACATKIQDEDNTCAEIGLRNQFTEQNYCNRWRWSVVILVVALLVMQMMMQE